MEGGQQQRPQNRIEDGFKDKHEKGGPAQAFYPIKKRGESQQKK